MNAATSNRQTNSWLDHSHGADHKLKSEPLYMTTDSRCDSFKPTSI